MRVPHFILKDYRCLLLRRDRNLRKEQPVLSAQFALSVLFSLQETPLSCHSRGAREQRPCYCANGGVRDILIFLFVAQECSQTVGAPLR